MDVFRFVFYQSGREADGMVALGRGRESLALSLTYVTPPLSLV